MADEEAEGRAHRNRLVLLLGMLGSDFPGEVVNAAKLANALAIKLGGWRAVLGEHEKLEHELQVARAAALELLDINEQLEAALRRERSRTTPRAVWVEPVTLGEKIDCACRHSRYCSDWERTFLTSLASRSRLSEKQLVVLDRIVLKCARFARMGV
jgi:hypothetical protein